MTMHPTLELLLPSMLAAALMFVWLPILPRERFWARSVVLGLTMLLHARYLGWRITSTLPAFEMSLDALWPYLFFTAELLGFLAALVSAALLSKTIDRQPEADAHEARLRRRGDDVPSVDVFIATYNEELEVVERTIVGAQAMDYPSFTVWVLDDGRRDWLRQYCDKQGVRYLTRPDNQHAKAGNINNALKVTADQTNAKLVMVLDADFVPRRDFLYRTVGFFDDKNIGLVQTPQSFFNPDPIQANLLTQHSWVDEQRYFFDIVQPSLDARDLAFCCGTSSIVRRDLVEMIGGFPTESVTEDMLLSYRLMRHGYISRYLNERLSIGLAPEGVKEYLVQRTRWCLGTIQQVHLRNGPLRDSGYTWPQRFGFLSSVLYYTVSFPFLFMCLIAPLLFFFLGVPTFADGTDMAELAAYLGPFYIMSLITGYWISDARHFPVLTDVSRALMMFNIIGASWQGLFKPFGQRFKVTAKGGDRSEVVVQWGMLWKFLLLLGLTLLGVAISQSPDYAIAGDAANATLVHYWSFMNVVLLVLTLLVCVELPRHRGQERFITGERARLRSAGEELSCPIGDLSLTGASIAAPGKPLAVGANVKLNLADIGWVNCTVRRRGDHLAGVAFHLNDAQRDRLIKKLYTSGYRNRIGLRVRPVPLLRAVAARLVGN